MPPLTIARISMHNFSTMCSWETLNYLFSNWNRNIRFDTLCCQFWLKSSYNWFGNLCFDLNVWGRDSVAKSVGVASDTAKWHADLDTRQQSHFSNCLIVRAARMDLVLPHMLFIVPWTYGPGPASLVPQWGVPEMLWVAHILSIILSMGTVTELICLSWSQKAHWIWSKILHWYKIAPFPTL